MQVLKFGGTSVANAENMSKVVSITTAALDREDTILVCSAISRCTDTLIEIGHKASVGDEAYLSLIGELEASHDKIITELLPTEIQSSIKEKCVTLFDALRVIAKGVFHVQELSNQSLAVIESYGEILSTTILTAAFEAKGIDAKWVDSRKLISYSGNEINKEATYAAVREMVEGNKGVKLFILPGFIASNEHGKTVTLGRGGSDYTASLYAAAVNASHLEIWTDVPGMMTTNPRVVPTARTIPHISYRAALELSHFGAKVVYPPTIQPAISENIPIYVKNTFDPDNNGTIIEANPPAGTVSDPIGICNSDDIALVSLEGSGMIGVPGFSARLFAAWSNAGINIILITQASSVHTMCIAIPGKDAAIAKKTCDETFAYEILLGKIKPLKVENDYSIVCLVCENVLLSHKGVTGRMLAALGNRGIPVRATAQGSSERNISVIVPSSRVNSALKYIHNEFFDRPNEKIIDLYVAGYGTIGRTLVKMIADNSDKIAQRTCKRIRLCGLATSRKFVINEDGIDASRAEELLEGGQSAAGGAYFDALANNAGGNAVFLDCTASPSVCDKYMFLVENGYNIVACNKIFFSSPYERYKAVKERAVALGVNLKYETTVGAALPILESISRCVNSGDTLIKVEAVLSGTLNYLCSNYKGEDFEGLVLEAKRLGYTEPNPDEDLSGRDVLRKLIILCREAGVPVNESDVVMEAFPVSEVKQRYDAATAKGMVLRYVASLENGVARIELKAIGADNPLYTLSGTDNAAIITTSDYPSPLVIQGAGAGPRQTAGGLLNDILSI